MTATNNKNLETQFSSLIIAEGTYLELLKKIELKLPLLLSNETIWNTVDVDYHPPKVERLWIQCGDYRIYLHRIHPVEHADKTLFHLHPWPSAMKILSGNYQMGVGCSNSNNMPPSIAATLTLTENSTYEMINPNGWHYVCPLEDIVYSVMIAGKCWPERNKKSDLNLSSLPDEVKIDMLAFFRSKYVL